MPPKHDTKTHVDPKADTNQASRSQPAATDDDRLGSLAKTESAIPEPPARERNTLEDTLTVVTHSFGFFGDFACDKIETLRRDLHEEDEPPWIAKLALGVLELALGAGAAAAGVRLAEKFVPGAGEVKKEFVKMIFEQGLSAGVAAGRERLKSGKDGKVVDTFLDAQRAGVRGQHFERQTQFTMEGKYQIKTLAEAIKLRDACSKENMAAAADKQYEATRDAWVSYLAQQKYGASGKRDATGNFVGPTTTNMMNQRQRDRDNKWAEDAYPSEAPSVYAGGFGEAPGVLTVHAELPQIMVDETTTYRMYGKPKVERAFLNGLNRTMREQYEGKPLSELKIPRFLACSVAGGADFVINADENGKLFGLLEAPRRVWAARRPLVGHPEKHGTSELARYDEGIQILLHELVATSIEKPRA